jgi:hypothetical protein
MFANDIEFFNRKKYKSRSIDNAKINPLIFHEKNVFFYENALDIIESADKNNKNLYLDVLGQVRKLDNECLDKNKKRSIKNKNPKNKSSTSPISPISPVHISQIKTKSISDHNLFTNKLSKRKEIKEKLTINNSTISMNSSSINFNTILKQKHKMKLNFNSLSRTSPKFYPKTEKNSVNNSLMSTITFRKNKDDMSATRISKHMSNLTKFKTAYSEFTKLDKDLDDIIKNDDVKNFNFNTILTSTETDYDKIRRLYSLMYDKETNQEMLKLYQQRNGKETLKYKINKMKNETLKAGTSKNKFETYFKNKYPQISEKSKLHKYKVIGDAKILQIPKTFSENYHINVNNTIFNEELRKIKTNSENIFDKLANNNKSNNSESMNIVSVIKTGLKKVENENNNVRNKIIKTRLKLEKSSLHIDPKKFVLMMK